MRSAPAATNRQMSPPTRSTHYTNHPNQPQPNYRNQPQPIPIFSNQPPSQLQPVPNNAIVAATPPATATAGGSPVPPSSQWALPVGQSSNMSIGGSTGRISPTILRHNSPLRPTLYTLSGAVSSGISSASGDPYIFPSSQTEGSPNFASVLRREVADLHNMTAGAALKPAPTDEQGEETVTDHVDVKTGGWEFADEELSALTNDLHSLAVDAKNDGHREGSMSSNMDVNDTKGVSKRDYHDALATDRLGSLQRYSEQQGKKAEP